MRSVVLDTETTGLNAGLGDRIIELGCIEVLSRRVTGNHFHRYINPERESEEGALKVHGIDHEFLQDKPTFDVEFLNLELGRLGLPPIEAHCAGIVDSLKIARELHPGKKNSLDALCERYQVAHAHRTLHGALLDAALLAEVYLAMTRGQESLAIELGQPRPALGRAAATEGERPPLIVLRPSAEELAEHASLLADMEAENKTQCVWRRFETAVEMLDRV